MKAYMILLGLLGAALTASGQAPKAQTKPFQGRVEYRITVTGPDARAFQGLTAQQQTVWIGDSAMRFEQRGGVQPQVLLLDARQKQAYVLDTAAGQAWTIVDSLEHDTLLPKVIPTAERATIAGYSCVKYKVEVRHPRTHQKQVQYVWAAAALPLSQGLRTVLGKSPWLFSPKGKIQGTPLRIVTEKPLGNKLTLTFEAVKVVRKVPAPVLLTLPSHYKVSPFDRLKSLPPADQGH